MVGRYGIDQLYYAGLFLALGLMMINMMAHSTILMILSNGLILLVVLRGFSRNIDRRRIENDKFLRLWNPVKKEVRIILRRIKEIRVHRYRKCPHCKKTLKLPIKRGKHMVKCPECKESFAVRVIV
jgi:tRNA(Ile2) C34 agmatinyltransferase TiaS